MRRRGACNNKQQHDSAGNALQQERNCEYYKTKGKIGLDAAVNLKIRN